MMGFDLKELRKSLDGPGFHRAVCRMLNDGIVRPDDFGLRELWSVCTGDEDGRALAEGQMPPQQEQTLFGAVLGAIVAQEACGVFSDASHCVGDSLVQQLGSYSKRPTDPAFDDDEPSACRTIASKRGKLVDVTIGDILSMWGIEKASTLIQARKQAAQVRDLRERIIVRGVLDADYDDRRGGVFRPWGRSANLYQATDTVSLTETDAFEKLEKAHRRRAGRDCMWRPQQLLVGPSMADMAEEAVAKNRHGHKPSILVSPHVDIAAPGEWLWGDFQRQFVWKEVWPFGVFQQMSPTTDDDSFFDREAPAEPIGEGAPRVVVRYKLRYYGGISAVDDIFVARAREPVGEAIAGGTGAFGVSATATEHERDGQPTAP